MFIYINTKSLVLKQETNNIKNANVLKFEATNKSFSLITFFTL